MKSVCNVALKLHYLIYVALVLCRPRPPSAVLMNVGCIQMRAMCALIALFTGVGSGLKMMNTDFIIHGEYLLFCFIGLCKCSIGDTTSLILPLNHTSWVLSIKMCSCFPLLSYHFEIKEATLSWFNSSNQLSLKLSFIPPHGSQLWL